MGGPSRVFFQGWGHVAGGSPVHELEPKLEVSKGLESSQSSVLSGYLPPLGWRPEDAMAVEAAVRVGRCCQWHRQVLTSALENLKGGRCSPDQRRGASETGTVQGYGAGAP